MIILLLSLSFLLALIILIRYFIDRSLLDINSNEIYEGFPKTKMLKTGDRIPVPVDYEVIDSFYHKDDKYSVLLPKIGDKYGPQVTVFPSDFDGKIGLITDQEIYAKVLIVYRKFKTKNKSKFIDL